MKEAQFGNEICSVLVILREKKNHQKMLQKVWPGNKFQTLLFL